MIEHALKMAATLGLIALLTFVAIQNRWMERGSDLLRGAPPLAATAKAVHDGSAPASAQSFAPLRAGSRGGQGVVEIAPDRHAQYLTDIEINGVRMHALVDTGASHVVLTAEDARAANIDPPASAYVAVVQTANGVATLAPARLREVRVGGIAEYDVEALVARPGATATSLLGMSFLKKLSSFQVADGRFVMKQ